MAGSLGLRCSESRAVRPKYPPLVYRPTRFAGLRTSVLGTGMGINRPADVSRTGCRCLVSARLAAALSGMWR